MAFNIDYCASYIASCALLDSNVSPATSYGYYILGICVTSVIIFVPYWFLRKAPSSPDHDKIALFSKVFIACFALQFLTMISLMLAALSNSSDDPKTSKLWDQLVKNNSIPVMPQPSQVSSLLRMDPHVYAADNGTTCSNNQQVIGYIPTLFYSNMFSIAFLHIKAKTKISDSKPVKDFKIGLAVVVAVSVIYLSYYLPFFIGNFAIGDEVNKRTLVLGTFDAIMTMPSAFVTRKEMNLFDLVYMLTMMMMITQAVVLLQFARENLLVFVEEHINQKLSKTLDWKNRGMDTKKKQRRTGGQDKQDVPAGRVYSGNGPLEN